MLLVLLRVKEEERAFTGLQLFLTRIFRFFVAGLYKGETIVTSERTALYGRRIGNSAVEITNSGSLANRYSIKRVR